MAHKFPTVAHFRSSSDAGAFARTCLTFLHKSTHAPQDAALSATAESRMIFWARSFTNGSQQVVRPTAKPVKPGTLAAVISHFRTCRPFSPRPRMMEITFQVRGGLDVVFLNGK